MKTTCFAIVLLALYGFTINAQKHTHNMNKISLTKTSLPKDTTLEILFGKGEPNTAYQQYFVGQSYLNAIVAPTSENALQISNVTFEPACRNNWHTHSVMQILLVTEGKGWYQEKGKTPQPLSSGDVVVIKPKVKHWHGATSNSWFTHIAILVDAIAGKTDWFEPVADQQYNQLKNN